VRKHFKSWTFISYRSPASAWGEVTMLDHLRNLIAAGAEKSLAYGHPEWLAQIPSERAPDPVNQSQI
jgi:hypothetical protein